MPAPMNGTHHTPADDVAMIGDPDEWPLWPYLPVKRYREGRGLEHGTIVDPDVDHDGPLAAPTLRVTHAMLPDMPKTVGRAMPSVLYANPEAVVADGWRVD
jgi:hypothetical protein